MFQLVYLRFWHPCVFLPAFFLTGLMSGCAKPTPIRSLTGTWHGMMAAGNVAVPSQWELNSDGTQSIALILPQGSLSSQGTFMARDGVLIQRTTARMIMVGGVQQRTPLANPIETRFEYQLADSTLTLTQTNMTQRIILTRDKASR